jgi:hypothetical protein
MLDELSKQVYDHVTPYVFKVYAKPYVVTPPTLDKYT